MTEIYKMPRENRCSRRYPRTTGNNDRLSKITYENNMVYLWVVGNGYTNDLCRNYMFET